MNKKEKQDDNLINKFLQDPDNSENHKSKSSDKKYPRFTFRLSDKEKIKLKYLASKAHKSMSDYVKSKALSSDKGLTLNQIAHFNKVNNKLQDMINNIRLLRDSISQGMNNLNQIAKKVNGADVKNIYGNNVYVNNINIKNIILEIKNCSNQINKLNKNIFKLEGDFIGKR